MVGGVVDRFYPITLLRHVVRPAVRAGCTVDLFVMLFPALLEGAFKSYWYRPVPNPLFANATPVQLEEYVMRHARKSGARRTIFYRQNFLRLDPLPRDPSWSRWFRHGERGHPALTRNLLWLQNIEMMWNWTRGFEGSSRYTHVVLARSDLHWIDDVDLELFADPSRVYSRRFASALCKKPRRREPLPDDKFLVVGRRVADAALRPYTAYFHDTDPQLDGAQSNEEFLGAVARLSGVAWKYVRKSLMPYFPALHMQQPGLKEPFLCLRGARMRHLMHPTDTCVHPSKVRLPFCEDFPLAWDHP